jgi:hypothetical protein
MLFPTFSKLELLKQFLFFPWNFIISVTVIYRRDETYLKLILFSKDFFFEILKWYQCCDMSPQSVGEAPGIEAHKVPCHLKILRQFRPLLFLTALCIFSKLKWDSHKRK